MAYTLTSADVSHVIVVGETITSSIGDGGPGFSASTVNIQAAGDTTPRVPPPVPPGLPVLPFPVITQPIPGPGELPVITPPQGGAAVAPAVNLRKLLLDALAVTGRAGRGTEIVGHGWRASLKAPRPGVLTIGWYQVPAGAHLSKARPVLVGSGHATIRKAGPVQVTVKLNAKGRALVRHARRVKLTAKATYATAGTEPVSVTRPFTLTFTLI